ncbi:MAG: LptF/LptG family permease [Chitinophagaceae bacterium]|nr:LptF/LptG family permease [Chitinophagaceae bacterium]
MIKKLDKLILKSFIGPFIITFFIAFFVLMMQGLWKYLDDLVGKGLDFITIGKFLWYVSASMLTLAMPIAILISTIMTFGNLGESFELVAIKSSGISLLRFMRPLMLLAVLFSGITFLFANYVIPYANLKFVALYNDIYYKKPAFDLKEGVFFTYIPNYAIKAGKKDPDGKTIRNVLIYEQTNVLQNNTIVAETGVMTISQDKRFLEFNLKNGYRYQESGTVYDSTNEYIRLGFTSFKKLFDLSALQKQTTNDSVYRNNFKMLSAGQINRSLDSLSKMKDTVVKRLDRTIAQTLPYTAKQDSLKRMVAAVQTKYNRFDSIIPDSARMQVNASALSLANTLKYTLENAGNEIEARKKEIQYHYIEWHRKFSLSMACFVLFFIGAPLGSIIRKGGLGMPLVVAIIFFLLFHLLNMFGEKFVKESMLPPFIGMWLAVIVLAPVGIFLTYKAMHDSQLFNKELYNRAFKKVKNLFTKKRTTTHYLKYFL